MKIKQNYLKKCIYSKVRDIDLLEKLPVEIQNKVYKFAHHPVATIFKKHMKLEHHRKFNILSIVKDLDNDIWV